MSTPDLQFVDDELLVNLAQTDIDAFEGLYLRYSVPVYRMSLRACGDPDLADDLTSTVFLKAYEKLDQYHERKVGTFRAWLFTITRNTLLDYWRRNSKVTRLAAETLPDTPDLDPGPEDIALSKMQISEVADVMNTLTERNRSIIELRLAGLSNREISEVMGLSISAVKSAQTRSYAHIRTELLTKGDRS